MSFDALSGVRPAAQGQDTRGKLSHPSALPEVGSRLQTKDQAVFQSQRTAISSADRARGKALIDEYLPKLIERPFDMILMDVAYGARKLWDRLAFERAERNATTDSLKAAREYALERLQQPGGDRATADALRGMLDSINRELDRREGKRPLPAPKPFFPVPIIPWMPLWPDLTPLRDFFRNYPPLIRM